jgi:hypothetical protein
LVVGQNPDSNLLTNIWRRPKPADDDKRGSDAALKARSTRDSFYPLVVKCFPGLKPSFVVVVALSARLNWLLKNSEKQIPRGLKPARNAKSKGFASAQLKLRPFKTSHNRFFQQPVNSCPDTNLHTDYSSWRGAQYPD